MKRVVGIIFCAFIVLTVLYSWIAFNRKGEVNGLEKRPLAVRPCRLADFPGWDAWLNDRFGGRDCYVGIANFVEYRVLHATIRQPVAFMGKNGWFYYTDPDDGDNLSDFNKTNLLDEQELDKYRTAVKGIRDWCDSNGIRCLFVITPNKHSVYPEHHLLRRPEGETRTGQLLSVLHSLDVPCVYPLDYLLLKKKTVKYPLYYETDTHWNGLGAWYGFEKIREAVGQLFPEQDFPEIACRVNVTYSDTLGDILPLLGVKRAHSTQISLTPSDGSWSDVYVYLKNNGMDGIVTQGKDSRLPKAVIFRVSFGTALVPYLSILFSRAEYIWHRITGEDKKRLLEDKPDLIIIENAERYAVFVDG